MKLKQGGVLIIQQVNFDKVLAKDHFAFPIIEKEDFILQGIIKRKATIFFLSQN
jgi:hypothetical protein